MHIVAHPAPKKAAKKTRVHHAKNGTKQPQNEAPEGTRGSESGGDEATAETGGRSSYLCQAPTPPEDSVPPHETSATTPAFPAYLKKMIRLILRHGPAFVNLHSVRLQNQGLSMLDACGKPVRLFIFGFS